MQTGQMTQNPEKGEFLIPIYIGRLLHEGKISVKMLSTHDRWFGVTYQEDRNLVIQSIRDLIGAGIYAKDLYTDLG